MKSYRIVVIPGDGIGPEVTQVAVNALTHLGVDFNVEYHEVGMSQFNKIGRSVSEETIAACNSADAVLFGATTTPPNITGYRSAILTLRQELQLYANIRPVRYLEGISTPTLHRDFDCVIFRENTEGLYAGSESVTEDTAITERIITEAGSRRIIQAAIDYLLDNDRKKLTLVHKSNILRATDGLFLRIFQEMCREQLSGKEWNDMLVDTAVMNMISKPDQFDVLVTSNMFGDILSDAGAAIIGGVGIAHSASIGPTTALFEPVHGSAPDIAGKGLANPYGILFSCVMLLSWLGETENAAILNQAITQLIGQQILTKDIGGSATTSEVEEKIIALLSSQQIH